MSSHQCLDCLGNNLIGNTVRDYLGSVLDDIAAGSSIEQAVAAAERGGRVADSLGLYHIMPSLTHIVPIEHDAAHMDDPSSYVAYIADVLAPHINSLGPSSPVQAAGVNSWFAKIRIVFGTLVSSADKFVEYTGGWAIMIEDFRQLVSVLADPGKFGFSLCLAPDTGMVEPVFPDGARFAGVMEHTGIYDLIVRVIEWDEFVEDGDYDGFASEVLSCLDIFSGPNGEAATVRENVPNAYSTLFVL